MGSATTLLAPGASCHDLLSCMFDLNELERAAYVALLQSNEATLDELAERLGRERSTVHRAVTKLVESEMARKENRGLEGGGYHQVYAPVPPEEVVETVRQRFDAIRLRVEHLLATFTTDMRHLARAQPSGRRPRKARGKQ